MLGDCHNNKHNLGLPLNEPWTGGDDADEYLWHFKQCLGWTPTEKAIDPTDGLQALLINYTSMNNEDIEATLRDQNEPELYFECIIRVLILKVEVKRFFPLSFVFSP